MGQNITRQYPLVSMEELYLYDQVVGIGIIALHFISYHILISRHIISYHSSQITREQLVTYIIAQHIMSPQPHYFISYHIISDQHITTYHFTSYHFASQLGRGHVDITSEQSLATREESYITKWSYITREQSLPHILMFYITCIHTTSYHIIYHKQQPSHITCQYSYHIITFHIISSVSHHIIS